MSNRLILSKMKKEETKQETKQEKKEVRKLVFHAIVALAFSYLALVLGKELCSQFEQLNVTLIVICTLSMLFIGYLHFRGIFAFWSVTDDADSTIAHLHYVLKSDTYDSKAKTAVRVFRSLFKMNIIAIMIYFVVTIINKLVSYQISESFYTSAGSIILFLTVLLTGFYIYGVRLDVFLPRQYTMEGRDKKSKKRLFWLYFSEIGFRVICAFWMLQLILPQAIFQKPLYSVFLGVMVCAFWGFYIWYLAQKDRV